MSLLRDMNRMVAAHQGETRILCGSFTVFRDWINMHGQLRAAPEGEMPVPVFAGVEVKETPTLDENQVMIINDREMRVFNLVKSA